MRNSLFKTELFRYNSLCRTKTVKDVNDLMRESLHTVCKQSNFVFDVFSNTIKVEYPDDNTIHVHGKDYDYIFTKQTNGKYVCSNKLTGVSTPAETETFNGLISFLSCGEVVGIFPSI